MGKITTKDIEAIKAFREKLDALHAEEPATTVKPEEWKDFFDTLDDEGTIPERYRGRIGKKKELVYTDTINGKPVSIPEGKEKTIYYDIAYEEVNKKFYDLQREYHKTILNALEAYFTGNMEKGASVKIPDILAEILEDPEIRKELEKEAQAARLPAIGSMPNSEAINWLYRVTTSSKGGRTVKPIPGNRHEVITTRTRKSEDGSTVAQFIRESKENQVIVEINQADTYLSKTNKTFTKVLLFTLQKMTAQHFPLEVGFPLQEMVDLGMYSNINNARRAVKNFFTQQAQTTLKGTVKKGKKTIKEEGGILFYHYSQQNGYFKLSVNPHFNMEFVANCFSVFPRFAYALSNNAFSLVRYIFFIARQNTRNIKEKGRFTISLDAVRANIGLPAVDEVKNRKYKQYIIDPIEKAIEEIEEALRTVPEAKEYGFTITPYGTDTNNINKWLDGYLEIGLRGDFAETFIRIATKAEEDIKARAKAKAKLEAQEEAKNADK